MDLHPHPSLSQWDQINRTQVEYNKQRKKLEQRFKEVEDEKEYFQKDRQRLQDALDIQEDWLTRVKYCPERGVGMGVSAICWGQVTAG